MVAKKIGRLTSDELLSEIADINLRLDSGKDVSLSVLRELKIDEAAIQDSDRSAPSRYAFWAYQYQRQAARVRVLEKDLDRHFEEMKLVWRKQFLDMGEASTEPKIREHASCDDTYRQLQDDLEVAREQLGILTAVREAMQHRCFTIGRLAQANRDEFRE